jgi:hypothetical protein
MVDGDVAVEKSSPPVLQTINIKEKIISMTEALLSISELRARRLRAASADVQIRRLMKHATEMIRFQIEGI